MSHRISCASSTSLNGDVVLGSAAKEGTDVALGGVKVTTAIPLHCLHSIVQHGASCM